MYYSVSSRLALYVYKAIAQEDGNIFIGISTKLENNGIICQVVEN